MRKGMGFYGAILVFLPLMGLGEGLLTIEQISVLPGAKLGLYVPLTNQGPGGAALIILARRHGLSMVAGLAERKADIWGTNPWQKVAGGLLANLSGMFKITIFGLTPEFGFMLDKDLGPEGKYGTAIFVTLTTTKLEDIAAAVESLFGKKEEDE